MNTSDNQKNIQMNHHTPTDRQGRSHNQEQQRQTSEEAHHQAQLDQTAVQTHGQAQLDQNAAQTHGQAQPQVHNSLHNLKRQNRNHVLALLHDEPDLSRIEIAKRSKLTKQTVTNIVNELLDNQIVIEKRTAPSDSVGRRPVLLDLNREHILAGGIELTRTSIRSVLMNNAGRILYEEERSIDDQERGEHAVHKLLHASRRLLEAVPAGSLFTGIGIGIQGVVHRLSGTVQYSKSVNLFNYPLRDLIQQELGVRVIVDQRVRAFATGEIWRRKKEGLRHVLCVYMNEGVGGAVIVNGKVYQGAADQAGKIGHMKVVPDGRPCYCGQRGCLVAYIATHTLLEQAGLGGRRFSELVEQLHAGHHHDQLQEAGRHLGFALGNAVNLLNPEAVIMGGELVKARQWFIDELMEQMANTASIPGVDTPIFFSEYQDNNSSTGAAAMAFYAWVEE